ncbi:hypothetical protein ACFFX0_27615 [Citricoccus parietis]|uniref:Uncharacterized protein n=1 Tax=Citricoccus parietis TaxID=592307 RepID=A0ABV5G728_9MICC
MADALRSARTDRRWHSGISSAMGRWLRGLRFGVQWVYPLLVAGPTRKAEAFAQLN